jgi:hypothetical protein
MKRPIPSDLGAGILFPILGKTKDSTYELYQEKIEGFERKCETSIINTLGKLDIIAMVKSDPYSLPYQKEIKITLEGESYFNGPYEVYRVTRNIAKELLNNNEYKIRFYIYIEVDTEYKFPLRAGAVHYHFRYYSH